MEEVLFEFGLGKKERHQGKDRKGQIMLQRVKGQRRSVRKNKTRPARRDNLLRSICYTG